MPQIPGGEPLDLEQMLDGDAEGQEVFFDQSAVLYAGSVIRRMREHAKLSQKQLADLIGTSQPHISDVERGAGIQGPTYLLLSKAARACGFSLTLSVGDGALELPQSQTVQKRQYAAV